MVYTFTDVNGDKKKLINLTTGKIVIANGYDGKDAPTAKKWVGGTRKRINKNTNGGKRTRKGNLRKGRKTRKIIKGKKKKKN